MLENFFCIKLFVIIISHNFLLHFSAFLTEAVQHYENSQYQLAFFSIIQGGIQKIFKINNFSEKLILF